MRFGVLVWNRNLYTYRMNFIQTSCIWHVVGERHRKPRNHKLIFPPFTLRVLTRVQKVSPELSDCRSKPLKNDGGVTFVETGVAGLPVWKQKDSRFSAQVTRWDEVNDAPEPGCPQLRFWFPKDGRYEGGRWSCCLCRGCLPQYLSCSGKHRTSFCCGHESFITTCFYSWNPSDTDEFQHHVTLGSMGTECVAEVMGSTCRMCWRPWVWARSSPQVYVCGFFCGFKTS